MALSLAFFFCGMATVTVVILLARVWWMPELISIHGASIDNQLVLTLVVAGIVFFLAQVGLGVLIWVYRAKRGGNADHWHENPKLEITWTVITAVVFIGLGIQGNRLWANYFTARPAPAAVVIEVTAQQFAWNFRYPGADGQFGRTAPELIKDDQGNYIGLDPKDPAGSDDILTQNIMAIPVNRPVRLILRTKDVTHSFFAPNLRVKQDAVPGMAIPVQFTATRTGEFEIACAELCGMQHYKMRARLLIMETPQFENWLKQRSTM